MDLSDLNPFVVGESEYHPNSEWELIETSGSNKPPPMSHHSSVEYQGKMYLFGGSNLSKENTNMYTLDLHRYQWNLVKAKAANNDESNLPKTRDEHSCVIHNDSMIIFGGFAFGERTNTIFRYSFMRNIWEQIHVKGDQAPCPRAGHSAAIRYNKELGDHMYIYGGKNEENVKLNDTWKFNLETCEWTCIQEQIDRPEDAARPLARSGHASQVYNDCMIIYGGIYEVTKELNDMHIFDFKKEEWVTLYQELNSPQKSPPSNTGLSPGSVGLKKSITKVGTTTFDQSPRKVDKMANNTNMRNTATAGTGKRPKIKLTPIGANKVDDRVIKLESPTSITMKNSFLIKNADPSFEKCYAQIRKRALDREKSGNLQGGYDETLTKQRGKRPPARDGHTGLIIGDCFYVFGGDRHHMPFNDFHMLDLKSEFSNI